MCKGIVGDRLRTVEKIGISPGTPSQNNGHVTAPGRDPHHSPVRTGCTASAEFPQGGDAAQMFM